MKPRQILRVVVEDVLTAAFICGLLLTWLLGPDSLIEAIKTSGLLTYIGAVVAIAVAIWAIEHREK